MKLSPFKICVLSLLTITASISFYELYDFKKIDNKKENLLNYSVTLNDNTSFRDKASYAIGASIGRYLTKLKEEQELTFGKFDNKKIIAGFIDSIYQNSQLTNEEVETTLRDLDEKISSTKEDKLKKISAINKQVGEEYLVANSSKKNVEVATSGLQYEYVTKAKDENALMPSKDDQVLIAYKGMLIDGTVFDEQKKPLTVEMTQLIQGLSEGISMMKKGEECIFTIPSDLAYKENAVGNVIKPYSTLIFNVKLVNVIKSEKNVDEKQIDNAKADKTVKEK